MMDEISRPNSQTELQEANFSAEVCADAAKLMREAIHNRDAYVINGTLVLKMMRGQEALGLGIEDGPLQDMYSHPYYGLRIALCIADSGPFKRGAWYTTSSDSARIAIIEATKDGGRNVTIPIENSEWKIVKRIARVNLEPEILEEATQYAKSLLEGSSMK